MSIEPFKKTKLQRRILFWCSIIAVIAVIIIILVNPDKKKCLEMNTFFAKATDSQLNGTVVAKILNPDLDSVVFFGNSTTSIHNIELYNLIKNGDSIASDADSPIFKIYRANEIIKIDLTEIYYCEYTWKRAIHKRWINP